MRFFMNILRMAIRVFLMKNYFFYVCIAQTNRGKMLYNDIKAESERIYRLAQSQGGAI